MCLGEIGKTFFRPPSNLNYQICISHPGGKNLHFRVNGELIVILGGEGFMIVKCIPKREYENWTWDGTQGKIEFANVLE
jgi:hypothetical protein